FKLRLPLGWWLLLSPVLAVALVYVGCMYYRDAHSVGADWASFLGLSRTLVYLILALVFFLPAEQLSSKSVQLSKVVMLLDVSGSMWEVDDLPENGQDLANLLKRQDKVTRFLTKDQNAFLNNLVKTNPVTCYRFGQSTDENPKNFPDPQHPEKKEWTRDELE